MNKFNIYKLLFCILLISSILFVIYIFWTFRDKEEGQDVAQDIQSICQKELETTNDVIEVFNGIPKPVNFSNFPEAKRYYTMITKSVKEGSNFAGHFTVARWGCGTDTLAYLVVDNKTGDIIAYSDCVPNYHLINYGLDSSFLVLEPVYAGQTREYYKIVNNKLELACSEVSVTDMYQLSE